MKIETEIQRLRMNNKSST